MNGLLILFMTDDGQGNLDIKVANRTVICRGVSDAIGSGSLH
jgi:hypothetical protein